MIAAQNDTICPQCHAALYCPCPSCRAREPAYAAELDHYHWDETGEIVICPKCGFEAHADYWLPEIATLTTVVRIGS